jgi:hypothetical protein
MTYLVGSVVLVGVLCVVDLVLTFGVIRRLRLHGTLLAGHTPHHAEETIPVGSVVGDFAVTTPDGERLTRADLTGRTLVGFFAPDCAACHERVPEFVDHAALFPGGVLAVAAGGPVETEALSATLGEVARVVVERHDGGLHTAFSVAGYPSLCLLDANSTVIASGTRMRDLPIPTAA